MSLTLRPDVAEAIVWSARGTCGERGCTDPECCCALCLKPIGVSEEDPRWEQHSVWCDDCELCRDSVPIQLFRDEGEIVYQASFHQTCFGILIGPKRLAGCGAMAENAGMSTTTPFYSYRDDGPITISFYDFRRSNLPGNAPREQREHVTRAFYTGALAGIKCLRDLARRRSVIIPDDVDHLAEELRQETLREADAAAVGDPDDAG